MIGMTMLSENNKNKKTGNLLGFLLIWVGLMLGPTQIIGFGQTSGPATNIRVFANDPTGNACSQTSVGIYSGTLYLCSGGVYTASGGGGTTINPTNGQVPYRVNSTTFGDSAFASNALNSTYLSATSAASGSGLTLTVAGGGTNENLILSPKGTGTVRLVNAAGTDFSRLQLGGTSSSFPAIKRNGAGIDIRLADDSGYAAVNALALTAIGSVIAGAGSALAIASKFTIYSNADGTAALTNAATTDFNRLQFGGTTSSFPALKRSSAALEVRLADDSAYAAHRALTYGVNNACVIRSGAGTPESAVTGNVCDLYLRTDGGANTTLYIKESGTGNTGWIAK
jgi:hypothetical protein